MCGDLTSDNLKEDSINTINDLGMGGRNTSKLEEWEDYFGLHLSNAALTSLEPLELCHTTIYLLDLALYLIL